jgi:hypothetical protein
MNYINAVLRKPPLPIRLAGDASSQVALGGTDCASKHNQENQNFKDVFSFK